MLWFFGAASLVAAVAAWVDWRTGQIPNWLTFSVLGAAPFARLFYTLAHTGHRADAAREAGYSLLAGVVCAILPLSLFRVDALGAGDVKLFAALGTLLLPVAGLEVELWSFCAAATIAPFRLAWDGKLFETVGNAAYLVANPFLPKARRRELDRDRVSWFRMGPAILLGTLCTAYLHS